MDDYLEETRKMLAAKDSIQDHMSISLYYQGKVLNRKYKLIRKAYEVFVLGLAIWDFVFHWCFDVLSFSLATFFKILVFLMNCPWKVEQLAHI
ncbi:Pycsar system effector family protein [Algoriphagus boritolerans]|uniref:Pycsar system effector family protein n=1 Tax=Algoriphagus boritolerans TaxID=308111 RepID=UPI002FCE5F5D